MLLHLVRRTQTRESDGFCCCCYAFRVYDSARMLLGPRGPTRVDGGRGPLMVGHPCSSEGRGLSCGGWGQIRSGTPGASQKSVCVCVCCNESVKSRAPGVTKFMAAGYSNHSLSHHALGYWSRRGEKHTKEEEEEADVGRMRSNEEVEAASLCSQYRTQKSFPSTELGAAPAPGARRPRGPNPAATIWWHLAAG